MSPLGLGLGLGVRLIIQLRRYELRIRVREGVRVRVRFRVRVRVRVEVGAGVSRVSTSPSRSLVWTRRSKARPCVSRSSTPTVSRGIRCWESCCSRWTKPTFAARLLTTLGSRTVKVPRPDLSRDRSFSPSLGVDQQTFWLGCVGQNFDLGFDPEAKISATTNIEAKIAVLHLV